MGGMEPTFIDLFAGIGGMRMAFERAGCRCVFGSEWNRFSQKTYAANFGDTPAGDITKVEASSIPDHGILVGGFPCQPFSQAGVSKRISLGRAHGFADETQGTLFFEIVRILRAKKPAVVVLENVKNLVRHDKGHTMATVMLALGELGYHAKHRIMDSAGYVPQHRERVFIVGFLDEDACARFSFPEPADDGRRLKDVLETNVPDKYTLKDGTWACLRRHADRHREKGNGFGYWVADVEGFSRTLVARYYKDGAQILIPQDGKNPRRLTPRECARLQGFPESFVIPVSDGQAYRQFGNSVAVPLVEELARRVVGAIKGRTDP